MSRQQMSFQLAYGETERKAKCKSCQGAVETSDLIVGVKSDSMYDPMWYHFHCFWTRCWYRKQMSRHLEDYAELAGFTKLTTEDKQRFKDALDDLTGGDTGASSTGLKRRSVSEDNLVDVSSKKSRSEVLTLPKLSLSATGLLSRSGANLASYTDQETGSANSCSNQGEEIVISSTTVVSVRNSPEGASVTISTTDGVNSCASEFRMNLPQWRKMRSVFNDVTNAATSMGERGERGMNRAFYY